MKLMTKAIERSLPPLGSTAGNPDALVRVKFFHPFSNWTWHATEYDPADRIFFGLVKGFTAELGYFSLDELESVKVRGLGIERDLFYTPEPLSEVMKAAA